MTTQLDLVQQLLKLTRADAVAARIAGQILARLQDSLTEIAPDHLDWGVLRAELIAMVSGLSQEMYAAEFSAPELEKLVELLSDATVQKLLDRQPHITEQFLTEGMRRGDEIVGARMLPTTVTPQEKS